KGVESRQTGTGQRRLVLRFGPLEQPEGRVPFAESRQEPRFRDDRGGSRRLRLELREDPPRLLDTARRGERPTERPMDEPSAMGRGQRPLERRDSFLRAAERDPGKAGAPERERVFRLEAEALIEKRVGLGRAAGKQLRDPAHRARIWRERV